MKVRGRVMETMGAIMSDDLLKYAEHFFREKPDPARGTRPVGKRPAVAAQPVAHPSGLDLTRGRHDRITGHQPRGDGPAHKQRLRHR